MVPSNDTDQIMDIVQAPYMFDRNILSANISTHSTPYIPHTILSSEYDNEDDPITFPLCNRDPEALVQRALDFPLTVPPYTAPIDDEELDTINRFTDEEVMAVAAHDCAIEFVNTLLDIAQGYSLYYPTRPSELVKDYDIVGDTQSANNAISYVLALLDSGTSEISTDLIQRGLTPTSWLRLTASVVGTATRGALRSPKINKAAMMSMNDVGDTFTSSDKLARPTTLGVTIAAIAEHLAIFFSTARNRPQEVSTRTYWDHMLATIHLIFEREIWERVECENAPTKQQLKAVRSKGLWEVQNTVMEKARKDPNTTLSVLRSGP